MMSQDQAWVSGRGSNDVVGPCREFVRIFVEGIRKLTRNKLRRSPEEDHKTRLKNVGCRLIGGMSDGCTAIPRILGGCEWLSRLGWVAELPLP
ncbi:hypothetical protein GW17_00044130 [Ensete ventricosum]|nr:hypothetical protein GW17_00044130 [Ensete ventricosum]RZS14834.1 hypothetical protein BHM03_00046581 [Ensete ventricosum]